MKKKLFTFAMAISFAALNLKAQVPLASSNICSYGSGYNNEYGACFFKDRDGYSLYPTPIQNFSNNLITAASIQNGTSNSKILARPFIYNNTVSPCSSNPLTSIYGDYSSNIFSEDEHPRDVCVANSRGFVTVPGYQGPSDIMEYRVAFVRKDYTNPNAASRVEILKGNAEVYNPNGNYITHSSNTTTAFITNNSTLDATWRDIYLYRFYYSRADDPYPRKSYYKAIGKAILNGRSKIILYMHRTITSSNGVSIGGSDTCVFDTGDLVDWDEHVTDIYQDETNDAFYVCGYANNPVVSGACKSFAFKVTLNPSIGNTSPEFTFNWIVVGNNQTGSGREVWNSILPVGSITYLTGSDGVSNKISVGSFTNTGQPLFGYTHYTSGTDNETGLKVYRYNSTSLLIIGQTVGITANKPKIFWIRLNTTSLSLNEAKTISETSLTTVAIKVNDVAFASKATSNKFTYITGEKISFNNIWDQVPHFFTLKLDQKGNLSWIDEKLNNRSAGKNIMIRGDAAGVSTVYTTGYFSNSSSAGDDIFQNSYSGTGLRLNSTIDDDPTVHTDKPTIFPNPATSEITIRQTEEIESLDIYDSKGVKVRGEQYDDGEFSKQIVVENLQAGIYLVRINKGISAKFIKR